MVKKSGMAKRGGMAKKRGILSIDQGTTSSRAMLFDAEVNVVSTAQQEFPQHFPSEGWVEHDPEDIFDSVVAVSRQVLDETAEEVDIAAIGITNQRETVVVWERASGRAIGNAIVWQDRRTSGLCDELREAGLEADIQARTGLLLDPYFSASKIAWLLDNIDGARASAERGELAFGTIDSFLIWRLSGGRVHATDSTNASRTSLYNIHTGEWDPELLRIFNVPASMLPEVKDCAADFGVTDSALFGREIPIAGVAGDQQAASIGQCCFAPGDIKSTYGTGCFVLMNTGSEAVRSEHRLLTTVAYQLDGQTTYAIEGSIFVAGAAVQWLRDGLGIIESAKVTESLASGLDGNAGVYVVPAFTGLGAPYWRPDVRGAIFGLTRATGPAEITRATLESVCYLTADLFTAMAQDGIEPKSLKVDGGMVNNDWLVQFLADTLDMQVCRPAITETTALGAAYLAGRQVGLFGDLDSFATLWRSDGVFEAHINPEQREQLLAGWQDAVRRAT